MLNLNTPPQFHSISVFSCVCGTAFTATEALSSLLILNDPLPIAVMPRALTVMKHFIPF